MLLSWLDRGHKLNVQETANLLIIYIQVSAKIFGLIPNIIKKIVFKWFVQVSYEMAYWEAGLPSTQESRVRFPVYVSFICQTQATIIGH